MPVTLRSYSKINLGLAIGPAQLDGFHALATVYQTLGAHDLLTVAVERGAGPAITLTSNDRRVPLDERNTVWKMLTRALSFPGRSGLRVRVHLKKRLPIQGGLGGGSANAVAALIGLERELAGKGFAPPLAGGDRLRIAAEVGSDVPLFLLGGAVLGLGRGEQVYPLADLPALPIVIALPDVGVSTPAAFRAWDTEEAQKGLTAAAQEGRLAELSRAFASAWGAEHASGVFAPNGGNLAGSNPLQALVQTGLLHNDFEQVVFRQNPFLGQLKHLLAAGSVCSGLSGSGSAVFGVYGEDEAAREAEKHLQEKGIRSMRSVLLGRTDYWAGMVSGEE